MRGCVVVDGVGAGVVVGVGAGAGIGSVGLGVVRLVLMLGLYVVVSAFGSTKDGHMWGPHARWRKPPGAALGAETRR